MRFEKKSFISGNRQWYPHILTPESGLTHSSFFQAIYRQHAWKKKFKKVAKFFQKFLQKKIQKKKKDRFFSRPAPNVGHPSQHQANIIGCRGYQLSRSILATEIYQQHLLPITELLLRTVNWLESYCMSWLCRIKLRENISDSARIISVNCHIFITGFTRNQIDLYGMQEQKTR